VKKIKSLFISDVHLGTSGSNAKSLLKLFNMYEYENLFIIGDFIDIWQIQSGKMKWKKSHTKVIEKVISLSKNINVVYITGNHDEEFRNITPMEFYNLKIVDEYIHDDFLLIHGDITDIFMTEKYKWVAKIGGSFYDNLVSLNRIYNLVRRKFNRPYWSLSKYIKTKAKNIAKVISNYENNLIKYVQNKGYNKVICGHIHHPEIKHINDFVYINTGDWIESNSFIIQDLDNNYELKFFENN
jgi:UDP-2,3-diacylglucosamine pyrophosphatase LpxH